FNTAVGTAVLFSNEVGLYNVGVGSAALVSSVSGVGNTAIGALTLIDTNASGNTAVGYAALVHATGPGNVAVGYQAGLVQKTGGYNIYLGQNVLGVAGENGTTRLGDDVVQTRTFIAGIRGKTTGAANAVPVVIDSNGQLGTISSSRRFKEDIREMGDS